MSQPSPSASLVSLPTTTDDDAITPTASTANLIPNQPQNRSSSTSSKTIIPAPTKPTIVKDYESAFASLSSSYGWGGYAPTSSSKAMKKQKELKDKRRKEKGKKRDVTSGHGIPQSSSTTGGDSATTGGSS